jgi:hypothetical protein
MSNIDLSPPTRKVPSEKNKMKRSPLVKHLFSEAMLQPTSSRCLFKHVKREKKTGPHLALEFLDCMKPTVCLLDPIPAKIFYLDQ